MMDMVSVIIIDEIHILNDERGLVIECLVARAMMTSAKTQRPIRIVGLSATLPNYDDVAKFIGAEGAGTFYFDSSYRPTPLKCGFYGIKNYGNADRANKIMNAIIYENLRRILMIGKQVIIFVHRRAETVSTAEELIDVVKANPRDMHLFDCENSHRIKPEVVKSRNEQVKKLFEYGFSVHNAGLLRKDRNLVEKMFMEGHIKVLVSTATLAWGVNLPAYAVMIKGTKMYDASTGGYKDVGIFDVQQIFGRAGRPQFDHEGEAIILTLDKQMDEYVKMMSNRQTIESNLSRGLDNCVNAEISCGTIGTLTDGIHWLKKSYFYQRVTKNPAFYGLR
jgi:replicative superfamily II helicase